MEEIAMDEEYNTYSPKPIHSVISPEPMLVCKCSPFKSEPLPVCKCFVDSVPSDKVVVYERKKLILSTVARTESYLRDRRIPELTRYLLTKVIAHGPTNPIAFLEKLLDDCMLFRAGHGIAPVLYETRHLEAVMKSFDPGQRGWLTAGQVRRAYNTLGLTCSNDLNEKISTDEVLSNLKRTQEQELFELLSAGLNVEETTPEFSSSSS